MTLLISIWETKKVNGSDTYKLEAVPHSARKKEETGYSKRVIYVDKKANLMVKVLYYDNNGNHSKTYEAGNIKPVAGTDKYRCYHMQMTDISKDHVTKLEFTKIKIDNDFSDQLFTRRTLEAGL
ncbi:outer membrane lipoprotein-sorting protein [Fulvivirga maritima]|uniref:outer membrane lipoprotein-sorting protein n=1 Tax=Fulvivirga maritima TaxID=2904247 RepID=UPI0021061860|nr:outer membrane lipoprotein-sorting protein [Fulvivirga maritima]